MAAKPPKNQPRPKLPNTIGIDNRKTCGDCKGAGQVYNATLQTVITCTGCAGNGKK